MTITNFKPDKALASRQMLTSRTSQFNPKANRRGTPLREMVESVVLLALAVLLFRTFAAEGYLISTGSMAPTLLGYHRRVECPACQFAFSRGAAFDKTASTSNIASAELQPDLDVYSATQCPNCGLAGINARVAPRNEGDQLLVQKLAYEFRDPRRWEVVVFQNQKDPAQAYVKRVAGLPGEQIQILEGDLYVNNELKRKPFDVQRAVRIPVSDYFHQPEDEDPDWRLRWSVVSESQFWQLDEDSISFQSPNTSSSSSMNWILYEHWIRTGGDHVTRVPLTTWPAEVSVPDDPRLSYENGELISVGTFTAFEKRQWQQKNDHPEYRHALEMLYEQSHTSPIVDDYGYNFYENRKHFVQHDLMLSMTISKLEGSGTFEAQLTDGAEVFRLVIDPGAREMALHQSGMSLPIWTVPFVFPENPTAVEIDFSLFDQQVVVAIDGTPVHKSVPFVPTRKREPLRRPARIGAQALDFELTALKLYRDVYYTTKSEDPDDIYELKSDEFFVLGDNSPVSVDSRVWENPAVPRRAFIGKPFVVHLPSRQKKVNWKGKTEFVRVPDFSRIRYIR